MPYRVIFAKAAVRHKALLKAAHLDTKARALLDILCVNPWQNPPPYEKLVGGSGGMLFSSHQPTASAGLHGGRGVPHRAYLEYVDTLRILSECPAG